MRTLIGCLVCAAVAIASANAMAEPGRRSGGLGFAFTGPVFNGGSLLTKELQFPAALGPDFDRGPVAASFGGGGGSVILGTLWIGGKGFGAWYPGASTSRGWAHTSMGGGGLELGFAAVNNDRWLVTPFVELGGIGYTVEVGSRASAMQIATHDVGPNAKATFHAASATLGLGARGHRLMLFRDSGGFTAGLELGALLSVAPSRWDVDGRELPASRPSLSGAYVRVFVGGGGFYQ